MAEIIVTGTDEAATAAISGDFDMAGTSTIEPAVERVLQMPGLEMVTLALFAASPGAADIARESAQATEDTGRTTTAATKRTARQAREVPGIAQPRVRIKGAAASEGDLAIARGDTLTAEEVTAMLSGLSRVDLAKIDAYERRHRNRATILGRISLLPGDEPWAGYDELTAVEVQAVLSEGDDDGAERVRSCERAHKNRAVLKAAEREHANA